MDAAQQIAAVEAGEDVPVDPTSVSAMVATRIRDLAGDRDRIETKINRLLWYGRTIQPPVTLATLAEAAGVSVPTVAQRVKEKEHNYVQQEATSRAEDSA